MANNFIGIHVDKLALIVENSGENEQPSLCLCLRLFNGTWHKLVTIYPENAGFLLNLISNSTEIDLLNDLSAEKNIIIEGVVSQGLNINGIRS